MKSEMKISGEWEYVWDNGVIVCLWFEEGLWEYIVDDDPETYLSGMFMVDHGTVIDYDGVFELPVEVRKALGFHYSLDI